jgi:hypothetical protein
MIFQFIDKIAVKWVDWRQDQRVEKMLQEHPEWKDLGLHRIEVGSNNYEMVLQHPAAYLIAEELAKFLQANNAKNYVTFDFMPRLDRMTQPVRATVQWAHGENPGTKAARLEKIIVEIVRHGLSDQDTNLWKRIIDVERAYAEMNR